MAQGAGTVEAAEAGGIDRVTLWKWRQGDAEYQQLEAEALRKAAIAIDAEVTMAIQRLREAGPLAVEALIAGIQADTKYRPMKVKVGLGGDDADDGMPLGERIQVVGVPDLSLSVQAADKLLARIAELNPRQQVDVHVEGTLVQRLEELKGDHRSD